MQRVCFWCLAPACDSSIGSVQPSTPCRLIASVALFFKRPAATRYVSPSMQLRVSPPYNRPVIFKAVAEQWKTGLMWLNRAPDKFIYSPCFKYLLNRTDVSCELSTCEKNWKKYLVFFVCFRFISIFIPLLKIRNVTISECQILIIMTKKILSWVQLMNSDSIESDYKE